MAEFEVHEEVEYFGEELGYIPIYQLSQADFNQACYSKRKTSQESDDVEEKEITEVDLDDTDSTGKRLYSGAYVVLRLFYRLRELFTDKRVVEIGCGTGVIGATICNQSKLHNIVVTDGNTRTTNQITQRNVERLCGSKYATGVIRVEPFLWPTICPVDAITDVILHSSVQALLNRCNDGLPFDVVLGSELMYYTTDIPQVFATVQQLLQNHNEGIFLHGHIFRRTGQIDEWKAITSRCGYSTIEVLPPSVLTPAELRDHPEWWRVRLLVTGKSSYLPQFVQHMRALTVNHRPIKWRLVPLEEDQVEDYDDDNDIDVNEEEVRFEEERLSIAGTKRTQQTTNSSTYHRHDTVDMDILSPHTLFTVGVGHR